MFEAQSLKNVLESSSKKKIGIALKSFLRDWQKTLLIQI